MNNLKKEQAIKEINVKEIHANWRTVLFIAIFVSLALGAIGGYFGTLTITNQARSDWISAHNAQVSKANQ